MTARIGEAAMVDWAGLRAEAKASARPLWDFLEERLGLGPEALLEALGRHGRLPIVDMAGLDRLTPDYARLPFEEAATRGCLLARDPEDRPVLILTDPWDQASPAFCAHLLGVPFETALAHPADLAALFARHEAGIRAMDALAAPAGNSGPAGEDVEALSLVSIAADSSPIVRMVRSTLYDALKAGASDIHLETSPKGLAVKYRLDGVLSPIAQLPGLETAEQAISRIKVMAELDIAEHRIPQDGRLKVGVEGREVDVRVSIMPSTHGEDAVLRILDRQMLTQERQALTLDQLGFTQEPLERIRGLATQAYGMLLVTGPTGSGKTTTLYAAISEINHGRDKIVTIEDPVEYQLAGVLQIPVNERKGLTFERGLRSILRHDPDKIMVGEIRDPETAEIAVQSALTGHLVFTTVHANNVFDVIGRFTHMGVDPYSFVAAINGIVAQRLLRRNCPHCSQPVIPDPRLLARAGMADAQAAPLRLMAGRGCGHCRGTGFKGRRAVAQILLMTDQLRELISSRAPVTRIKEEAARGGTKSLRAAALEVAAAGETTLEEVDRVTLAE
ncbi:MAG: GspE/PulE family protein [Betaproteobacteria bacterium]|nr:GspE/PulE family protein [Betaproteobacteria bacterium]